MAGLRLPDENSADDEKRRRQRIWDKVQREMDRNPPRLLPRPGIERRKPWVGWDPEYY